ncbi:uncharacterized protein E0L32_008653 [Thyridium curvatum]|uniref:Uncharacterized protein n=1 Tax=Thyridium curvatum TaxID=1093900 RepID=A0A507AVB1_9PEZI|nr:uncharacterized protein E0L32_008653 [Thyridium curvatum]TPX10434.1 hypothetical protein E0L32_008653 [Thyridium curvatum]
MAGQPDNSTTFGKGSVPSKAGKSCPRPDIESGPSASAARGLDDHEQREKKYPFEYDDDSVDKLQQMPGGWKKHALEQCVYSDQRFHRRFGSLTRLLIIYLEIHVGRWEDIISQKIEASLDDKFFKPLDLDLDEKKGDHVAAFKQSFDPFVHEVFNVMKLYEQIVSMDVKNAHYHRASLSVHAGVYRGLRDEHGFSKEECAFMERADDFVYTKWGHIEAFADVVIRDCPKLVQRLLTNAWGTQVAVLLYKSGRQWLSAEEQSHGVLQFLDRPGRIDRYFAPYRIPVPHTYVQGWQMGSGAGLRFHLHAPDLLPPLGEPHGCVGLAPGIHGPDGCISGSISEQLITFKISS